MKYQIDINDFIYKKISFAIKNIEEVYFTLDLANLDDENISIYRERAYCYELYHQLRSLFSNDYPFIITGEPDKRGHPVLKSSKNPDFIIHSPGNMNNNFILMEVKTAENVKKTINSKDNGVNKDIETFKDFLKKFNYECGIYLIYGELEENYDKHIKEIKKRIKVMLTREKINKKIYLIIHKKPLEHPKIIELTQHKTKKL